MLDVLVVMNAISPIFVAFVIMSLIYVFIRFLQTNNENADAQVAMFGLSLVVLTCWIGFLFFNNYFFRSESTISNAQVVRVWAEGRWQSDYYTSLDIDGEIKTYEVRVRDDWGSLSAGEQVTVTVVNDSEIVEVQR
ncbi:MAG: hypothetical protein K8R89_09580 [Anaerolineae bacterium]|nr:hypothetical protein [Anaerolineae bacterium]